MYQLIHNLALSASLTVLVAALWQDWGLLPTLKKMVISYLGFFILGAILSLAVRIVPHFEKEPDVQDTDAEG